MLGASLCQASGFEAKAADRACVSSGVYFDSTATNALYINWPKRVAVSLPLTWPDAVVEQEISRGSSNLIDCRAKDGVCMKTDLGLPTFVAMNSVSIERFSYDGRTFRVEKNLLGKNGESRIRQISTSGPRPGDIARYWIDSERGVALIHLFTGEQSPSVLVSTLSLVSGVGFLSPLACDGK
jgi:hypothetical protein